MIRHYEKIGLILPPPRSDGGYRAYSEPDVHRLRFIAHARDLGFPIEEIGKLLELWADGKSASREVKALAEKRAAELGRWEERRVGKGYVSTGRYRWSPDHEHKKQHKSR